MPVSPYIGQTTFTTSRPYQRTNTGSYGLPSVTSNSPAASKYLGSDSSATGYKAGGYGKPKSPIVDDISSLKPSSYLASRYKTPDMPESQTLLELKLKKSNSNSSLLTGNTANIMKNFNKAEDTSRVPMYLPPKGKYLEERKFCGKGGGLSIYANQYLNKINGGREFRPREINARDINTKDKPNIAHGFDGNSEQDSAPLTRASRHVVRLTIKREELDDPFVVKDKTLKTIAQRLIEKYTEKEKKPDPYEYTPRKRLYENNGNEETVEQLPRPSPIPSSLALPRVPSSAASLFPPPVPSSIVTFTSASDTKAESSSSTEPTVLKTLQKRKKSLAELRATLSTQSSFDDEGGDVASRLLRATSTAAKKRELDNLEEVKDAIIAAVLHPDVDIESDEEMKELVKEKPEGPTWREASGSPGKQNEAPPADEGQTIVGQLKRFVKKQVSTKGREKKKKSSEKKDKSSKKSKKEKKTSENQDNETASPLIDLKEEDTKSKSSPKKKKESIKTDESPLSADLIFGSSKSSKLKKSKDRSIKKSSDGENNESLSSSEKHSTKEKIKSSLSLLSPKLVYNNLTSDEENDARSQTNTSEPSTDKITGGNESGMEDLLNKSRVETNQEKTPSKIPKLKKKVKKEAEVEKEAVVVGATEALPKIKVSSVGSPSEDLPKGTGETKEKVTDLKEETRNSEVTTTTPNPLDKINKKISSKTSCTKKEEDERGFETSDHHNLESTSCVESKKSSTRKEIESTQFEKSSPDDKKEKVTEQKSISDSSAELKTSKKSQAHNISLRKKDKDTIQLTSSRDDGISTLSNRKEEKDISAIKNDEGTTCDIQEQKSEVINQPAVLADADIKQDTDNQTITDTIVENNLEIKQEDEPTDASQGKKALKRPRQIGVPATQENLLGNADLMNARKILKRPVKKVPGAAVPEEKKDQPTTPEDPTKKLWKRPIAQLVPPKEGDQFLQARNILKKPVVKPKAPLEDKDDKPTGATLPDLKVRKFKKIVPPTQKEEAEKERKQRASSPCSSDEEDADAAAKKTERPKRPLKPRPASNKDTPDINQTPSSATNRLEGSESAGSGKSDPKLSACQSADSGYGSSPSTPQPTNSASDIKDEEACSVCGTNCHKKCEKQMANLCGVNQKLLAEALSSVKKAGSADGTSRALASPTKGSSVSASESETTTEDESETDTDSDYFGMPEIRPPLQTRPKFKKYTVNDFSFVKVLGKGSYGKVMLAQQKDSENYFAVKCLKKDVVLEDNDVECTLIERKVLSLGTKHPYLCHLFCTFQTPSHLFFVMEYLTGGDLMFHIQHCGRFDEYRAGFYAAEITSGLKFLHSKGIIYRDLKLDNILLDYQGHIRIADFGMCKLQVYLDRYADTFCGTPDYMAPEVIKGQHYNQCVDWWSFGVLLYEMLTGKSPFKGCDEDHLFWLICNDEPFYPKFLSMEATEILKGLLDKDSNRRLGIPFSPYGEIQDHSFFKYVDWGKIDRKEVETPYKPRLRHILDVQYFDKLFTKRHAALTPLDESILATMDQTAFTDFSYTNPNITD